MLYSALDTAIELSVVVAALVLVLASYFLESSPAQGRWLDRSFALLGLLAALCFINYGTFREHGSGVHRHEQFHFFVGSKYLREVRYDGIYEAGLLALTDAGGLRPGRQVAYRDLLTFGLRRLPLTADRERELRGRFTPARWRAFQQDVLANWVQLYAMDYGNTGSPAWAMVAGLFTRFLPLTPLSARLFGALDLALLLLLFVTAAWALGLRAAGLAMVTGLLVPLVYLYLGGSILRLDWVVALGFSVCFWHTGRFRTAGLCLGYAVASKFFAGLIVLPFGLRLVVEAARRRVARDDLRFVAFALLGLVLSVVLSGMFFGDFELWPDYVRRLEATFRGPYYAHNHSFQDFFLQAYHEPATAWRPVPARVAAANFTHHLGEVRGLFVAAQLCLLTGIAWVAARNRPHFALALGPLAVFVLTVSNRYYWQMWMISTLALAPTSRKDTRSTAYLCAILGWIASMNLVHIDSPLEDLRGGYWGSYWMFAMLASLVVGELIAWGRARWVGARRGTTTPQAATG